MSLKMFHIVFIVLSIAITAGFGFWALGHKQATGDVNYLYMGIASLTASVTLVLYFFWFIAKVRRNRL